MDDMRFAEYEYYMKNRPHVVILGAGASCAAIPNGDKNGKRISAMSGFIDKLGLTNIISKVKINTASDNLEDIYMELDERSKTEPDCNNVKEELEKVIWDYMSDFVLPDEPTVYDYLVMSLTSKDLIATFNWDPFLVQAIGRAQKYTQNIPQVAFLHGNVAVGYCPKDNIMGNVGRMCKCGTLLRPMKLLFPIKKKELRKVHLRKKQHSRLPLKLIPKRCQKSRFFLKPQQQIPSQSKILIHKKKCLKTKNLSLKSQQILFRKSKQQLNKLKNSIYPIGFLTLRIMLKVLA